MNFKNKICKYISLVLVLCILPLTPVLIGCEDDYAKDTDSPYHDTDTLEDESDTTDSELEFSVPTMENTASLHMIQQVDSLEGWQSGKTLYDMFYFVEDMMDVLDSLEWKNADGIDIAEDFHFRIDIERPSDELEKYKEFIKDPYGELDGGDDEAKADEDISSSTEASDECTNEKIAVQYLINYDERIVNMRLLNYSSEIFDIYASLDEYELKILELCLKAYFGPQNQ